MQSKYVITVRPLHEREAYIKTLREHSHDRNKTFDVYETQPVELEVITLPIDVPIYRMNNGRTQTEQIAHLKEKENIPPDFFSSGEENESAQQEQHKILWNFAEDERGVTPITDVLEKEHQREPILVTPRGVVVNGNRRLAAMRELFAGDKPTKFPHFANVVCAVLPPLTPNQIMEIEVRLQMRPETRLTYGWVNECLMVERLINSGKDEKQVALLMRERPKDITAALAALNEANIYLQDWLHAPNDYRRVKDDEQFFYDFPARLRGKEGLLLEASRRIGWLLVERSGQLGRRVYSYNRMFGDRAPEVLLKLADRIDVSMGGAEPSDTTQASGDELDIDLGETPSSASLYEPLLRAIDNKDRRDEIFGELRDVCETLIAGDRTVEEGKLALDTIHQANRLLGEVDFTKAVQSTHAGIGKQLEAILHRATELKQKIELIMKAVSKN
ncbi:MAG TPA: hypothetical protein VNX86_08505 [Rhizomicrobium sp.]|jgi:hypothetical protein|nr:hypothetical protein [Rhizomicrobium sp.]